MPTSTFRRLAVAVILGVVTASASSAQTDLTISYLVVRASAFSCQPGCIDLAGSLSLPRGFEVSSSSRVGRVMSVVGQFDVSASAARALAGATAEGGTVTDAVFNVLGGVRASKTGTPAFGQILAGLARSSQSYRNVNEHGFGESSFDGLATQGSTKHLEIQPDVGVVLKVGARTGILVERGRDFLLGSQTFLGPPKAGPHLRLAAGVTVGLNRR
jgi:hypothetical protein